MRGVSVRGGAWRRGPSGSRRWWPDHAECGQGRRSAAGDAGDPRPRRCLRVLASRPAANKSERPGEPPHAFDPVLLEFLVCPLSKKPLRYEESTNELINDELGIAYPIIVGIPNMIPQAARMMAHQNKKQEDMEALDHN